MRLSAAIIARNEEAYIGDCLASIRPLVDEVVVIDTGSTDITPDIVREHGAIMEHVEWCNDFAWARNIALDKANGDWILYVDADETVAVKDDISPFLADPSAIAGRVLFQASHRLTSYREYRLFRNRPDIRFRGKIHESVVPDINAIVARGEGRIIDLPVEFTHHGYEGDLRHKHRRNAPILNDAVKDDPTRVYLWYALGEALAGLGSYREAEAARRQALVLINERPPHPSDVLVYAHILDMHLDIPSVSLPDAPELLSDMRRQHPADPYTIWYHARFLALDGNYELCRKEAERLIAFGPEGPDQSLIGYDRLLFTSLPLSLIATCFLKQSALVEAHSYFARAQQLDPD
ncbi:MAG: glycosyltransferase, partial [Hyphomicrobiaceae bacterium]